MKPARSIPALALSMDETAQAFSVSKPIVYQLVESGVLRTFVIGRRRLATPAAIQDAIRTLEEKTVPLPGVTPHSRRAPIDA